jgi:hypothetical protein
MAVKRTNVPMEFASFNNDGNAFGNVKVISDPVNCKFMTLVGMGGISNNIGIQKCLEAACKDYKMNVAMLATINNEEDVKWLLKSDYKIASVVKLPLGYNDKYQFHVTIYNPFTTKVEYLERLEKEGVVGELPSNNEKKEKRTFREAFKLRKLKFTQKDMMEAYDAGVKDNLKDNANFKKLCLEKKLI